MTAKDPISPTPATDSPSVPDSWLDCDGTNLFSDLDIAAIQDIRSQFTPLTFVAGQTVITADEPADRIFLVVTGKARLWSTDIDSPQTLLTLGPGDQFGETSVTGNAVYHDTVTALTYLEVLSCPVAVWNELTATYPKLTHNLCRGLSRKLVNLKQLKGKQRPRGLYSIAIVCADAAAPRIADQVICRLRNTGTVLSAMELMPESTQRRVALTHGRTIVDTELDVAISRALGSNQSVAVVACCEDSARRAIAQCDQVLIFTDTGTTESWGGRMADYAASCKKRTLVARLVRKAESVEAFENTDQIRSLNVRLAESVEPGDESNAYRIEAACIRRVVRAIQRKRIGLALGGGGAKGLAHIGVLEVLAKHQIEFDFIAGTSAGAIVAAAHASGMTMDRAADLFRQEMTPPRLLRSFSAGRRLFLLKTFRSNRLQNVMRRYLGDLQFHQLNVPIAITAVDLLQGELLTYEHGDVVESILASINHPVFGKPIMRDGRALVDGGVLMNVPAAVLADAGCDQMIVVDVGSDLSTKFARDKKGRTRSPGYLSTMIRTLEVTQQHLIGIHRDHGDLLIQPDTSEFRLEDFHDVDALVEKGRVAARDAVTRIRALLSQAAWTDRVAPIYGQGTGGY